MFLGSLAIPLGHGTTRGSSNLKNFTNSSIMLEVKHEICGIEK